MIEEIKRCLIILHSYRLNIKNFGTEENSVDISAEDGVIATPKWFKDEQGIGQTVEGDSLRNVLKIKAINDGNLRIDFRGIDKKYNNERIPIWIDYKSIRIDGKEILSTPVATWHDKPYHYEMPVKDGQQITVEVEQKYHNYTEDELKDLILKLNLSSEYIRNNIDSVMSELEKQFPIISEETKRRIELENKSKDLVSKLTTYRLNIKNFGTEENSVDISAEDGVIATPKWFKDEQGIGQTVEGDSLRNVLKIKAINDGNLRIDFRGIDKKYNNERIPIWIDYKSIKIDGKEILSTPVATWHDKPYRYEMPVKDGQEITLEIEQKYHKYTEDELKDSLFKTHKDDNYLQVNYSDIYAKICRVLNVEKSHSWGFVKNHVLSMPTTEIKFEELDSKSGGPLKININNVHFECVLLNSSIKKLTVFLSAVGRKETIYPIFHRISWCDNYNGVSLYFDDPTRYNYNFVPAYYFGNPEHHYLRDIYAIIKKIAQVHAIKNENITFISSSNGGFGVLWLCDKFIGSRCFAYCPQIDIPLHKKGNLLNGWDLSKVPTDRINLHHIIKNTKSQFFIYSNIKAESDKLQMDQWFKYYNKNLKLGMTKLSPNMNVLIVDIDAIKPHEAQPDKDFSNYLVNDYYYHPNDYKLQEYLDKMKIYHAEEIKKRDKEEQKKDKMI